MSKLPIAPTLARSELPWPAPVAHGRSRRLAQALKEAAARESEQAAKAAGAGRSSVQM